MGSNMPHRRIAIVVPATIMKLQLLVDLRSMKIEIVKMHTIIDVLWRPKAVGIHFVPRLFQKIT